VLTVREELIRENPALVQTLVNYVQGAGTWLDAGPKHRAKAAQIASNQRFFNQDPAIIQYVMDNPTDRVTYGDLRMLKEEFDDLMRLSLEAKTIKAEIPFERYVDERFVHAASAARIPI
jgi:NitT/TauT family transport system substrate-binding protein